MKHIVILGAGISGLSLGWFLKQKGKYKITIVEKTSRPGGWIQTQTVDGYLFEQGPRSCRTRGNGIETLKLIEELGLENEVITADPSSRQRYLYTDKQLQKLPSGAVSLLFSPWLKMMMKALWNDWRSPKGSGKDESIEEFISRRLSPQIAAQFMDPLVSGIFAGDISKLSIKSCFPDFFLLEQQHGGLLKAFLAKKNKKNTWKSPFQQKILKSSIFSFKEGMETLPCALARHLKGDIIYHCEPIRLEFSQNSAQIHLKDGKILTADHAISTLPSLALAQLMFEHCQPCANWLHSIPCASVAVINLGYHKKVLDKTGFGYLIPSKEKEKALGVVWDSSVFPQQNVDPEHCRLTVMVGGMHKKEINGMEKENIIDLALETVKNHLHIKVEPNAMAFKLARHSIPQYLIGHQDQLNNFENELKKLNCLHVLGNSFYGLSVNDCIANSRKLSQIFN